MPSGKEITMVARPLLLATLISVIYIGTAAAQHVWLDDNGVKQYSDLPPPMSVPQNRILKAPGSVARTPVVSTSSALADDKPAASPEPAAQGPMTTAERNADFLKRKAEREEKEKKAAEEAKQAAEKARNCDRAKEYRRMLDSGQRIGTTESNGERSIMSDERRKQEAQETGRVLSDCK